MQEQVKELSSKMPTYIEELTRAMSYLGSKDESLFLGQAVSVEGTGMSKTLININPDKLIEFPVEEDFQLGVSIGMALNGIKPICIFPRWNFLLLATNQLVNHLDKLKELSASSPQSHVVIRTAVGSESPMNPGPQHIGDFTAAFKLLCGNISIHKLDEKKEIFEIYKNAFERKDGVSSLIVEISDKYNL